MKKKILFIDDDKNLLMITEIILSSLGYEPIIAEGGAQGINLLTKDLTLIFLDLMMPDICGLDVLKHIRKNQEYDKIPVILQTGAKDAKNISEAYRIGVNGLLLKPYNKQDLKDSLTKYLA